MSCHHLASLCCLLLLTSLAGPGCTSGPDPDETTAPSIRYDSAWWQASGQSPAELASQMLTAAAPRSWTAVRLGIDIPPDWQYEDFRVTPDLPADGALIYRFKKQLSPFSIELRAHPMATLEADGAWTLPHLVAAAQQWLSELPAYQGLALTQPLEGIDLFKGQPVGIPLAPHTVLHYYGQDESMRRVWLIALLDEPFDVLHLCTVVFASTAGKEDFLAAREVLGTLQWVHILPEKE